MPLGRDESITLHRGGISVAQDQVRQGRTLDLIEGLLVETLVLKIILIPVTQGRELIADDPAEGGSDDATCNMILSQSTSPQIDGIDGAIGLLERRGRCRIRADLIEAGVWRQAQRLSSLVQCAQAEIMAALDIDGRQVHSIRRINQQVPQAIDKLGVQRIRQVARQVPKEAICARSRKSCRIFKKRFRQRLLGREVTYV